MHQIAELPVIDGATLVHGDAVESMDQLRGMGLAGSIDMVFADPPYFIDKADWDKPRKLEEAYDFHEQWLAAGRDLLAPKGSLWVTGTYHAIHVIGFAAQRLGMRIINGVTWEKPYPPPCWTRSCFVHATESVLWLAKGGEQPHFNYACMRALNEGKQMRSHWRIAPPRAAEKRHGRHPTQKPIALVERCILATTQPGDLMLDPFVGSGTTLVAAVRSGRRGIGIDNHQPYLDIARARLQAEHDSPAEAS